MISAMAVQQTASSSLSSTRKIKYRYDVFLSFRGEDTRHNFTVILYEALHRKGINAFIDHKKLGKGERISPALRQAIERSRISIIVFSTNYATSTWCLEELAHIIRCKKEKNQLIMPIFYKVDPEDVQHQRNSFGEAMAAHEERFRNDMDKVRKWRSALSEAASLSTAWLFDNGYEFGFIERIVGDAYALLPPKRLHKTEHMVGLERRIEKVKSLLDESDDGVCMLGIHGTGGLGKTTLAKALYNSVFYQFEGSCFLFDVREASTKYQGIVRLQQTLLSEILGEKRMRFGNADEGISMIKHRLSYKKVLLVLDDVNEVEQLEQLAGGCDWFGSGSKVIITTRNKQLLIACNIEKTYEMMELKGNDSLELFCWHAFHMSQPPKDYQDMSRHVVSYAQGLPLALTLIGSNLALKSLEEWRSTIEQYERIPERTIHEVLKISYDCLQDDAKHIFLDIACFFQYKTLQYVKEILEACDLGAMFFIEVLVSKSLITVDGANRLCMHNLIQEMGRELVRQEAQLDPSKCSRIWHYKDVFTVLCENSGSSYIEGIMLDPPKEEEVIWSGMAFEKMDNLKILIVRNAKFSTSPKYFPNSLRCLDWEGYPSTTLPSNFSPKKLGFFNLCGSLFRLEESLERFQHVTYMNFSKCKFITEVPDISQLQSLRRLLFKGCGNLIKVHESVGALSKLEILDVSKCTKLTSFPHEIKMPYLQELNLSHCKSLEYFPHIVGKMDALEGIYAEDTAIKELPPSIGNLHELQFLLMNSCKSLEELPKSLFTLQNLRRLDLGGIERPSTQSLKKLIQESQPVINCTNLDYLNLEDCGLLDEDHRLITLICVQNLEELILSWNDFVSLPEGIKQCANLRKLEVNNCERLRDIPVLPSKLREIEAENCTSLSTESLGRLWSQAKKVFRGFRILMPPTTFPDWFNDWCKGGTLCFRARQNFPRVAFAFELGKADTRARHFFQVSMSINGCKIQNVFLIASTQGHMCLFDPGKMFEKAWNKRGKHLELDWNDVEIQFVSEIPDVAIVSCGVYVYKHQTNMENVQFKSALLSVNTPTTSLKRKAIASPPTDEPPDKFLRN